MKIDLARGAQVIRNIYHNEPFKGSTSHGVSCGKEHSDGIFQIKFDEGAYKPCRRPTRHGMTCWKRTLIHLRGILTNYEKISPP